jgi:hypothetical protein
MPLWQEAPRGAGAANGLAGTAAGWADADNGRASDAPAKAIATRVRNQGIGIDVTGKRDGQEKGDGGASILEPARRMANPVGRACKKLEMADNRRFPVVLRTAFQLTSIDRA